MRDELASKMKVQVSNQSLQEAKNIERGSFVGLGKK